MWVVVLALFAAVLSAVSAAGEQRVAARVARGARGAVHGATESGSVARWRRVGRIGRRRLGFGAAFVLALLASPLWLSSWLLDAGAFAAQAAALHLGSISAVQPLMVTTLLFTLPLAALGTGRRPGVEGWFGAVLICVGLVLVLSTRTLRSAGTTHHTALLTAIGVVVLGSVALVIAGRGRGPSGRAALLSVAAGALFAVGASLTKLTAATFVQSGLLGLVTSWPGYALAVVSLTSFLLQQAAYASGPLAPAMTAVVITDPLVSYLLGITGFGEAPPHGFGAVFAVVLGAPVLGIGVAVLARSPVLARTAGPAPVAGEAAA